MIAIWWLIQYFFISIVLLVFGIVIYRTTDSFIWEYVCKGKILTKQVSAKFYKYEILYFLLMGIWLGVSLYIGFFHFIESIWTRDWPNTAFTLIPFLYILVIKISILLFYKWNINSKRKQQGLIFLIVHLSVTLVGYLYFWYFLLVYVLLWIVDIWIWLNWKNIYSGK